MISSSGQTTSLKCFNLYFYFLCMNALPAYISVCSACWGQKWVLDHWKWSYKGFELPLCAGDWTIAFWKNSQYSLLISNFSTPSASLWIMYPIKLRQASTGNNLANWKSTWLGLCNVLSLKNSSRMKLHIYLVHSLYKPLNNVNLFETHSWTHLRTIG